MMVLCSDKPGNHNFDLLKKLVLPDGSVLRAQLPGRPTLHCLFADPARDGTRFFDFTRVKIWNLNKYSGVVGAFNCQGAGWCKVEKRIRIHDASPGTLSSSVGASDVDLIAQVAGPQGPGHKHLAVFSGDIIRLSNGASVPVILNVLEYELFHFCPRVSRLQQ